VIEVRLSATAKAQIAETLVYTLGRFGQRKYDEYVQLVAAAITALAMNPESGTHRPDIHPDAWTYHIAQPGKGARHLFLYRIRDAVEVARFLYDAMDLSQRRPEEWSEP
jgi:plasmid stabilization system protein ParE